ncbi:unnamed protein product [Adineta steineri]|uniref:RING-type domain-containing protein n=1 Tax=Adineta steineri TaxID=433720 RepID=A0A814E3K8_9BILA|nr:unnamed protein product [Adineta steineri]CAF0980922.1 unnamed protein product [Adineta steineri]CAF3731931.1 unnamed protein product [Adineta steineri]CAF3731971.1 unnamed protein product [Adineta steineri]CAF3901880.1 unnamed protein product [Adineta steineri]
MGDSRRSLSPIARAYSELQQILTSDQFDQIFPLINSAIISNTMDDEEIARQHQEDLFGSNSMEIDESFPNYATTFNPQRKAEIDADAAYARQLQEEEYSRRSVLPTRSYMQEINNKRTSAIITEPDNAAVFNDAELAARLQEEENQRGRRHRQRPVFPPQRINNNRTFQSNNEPEIIPIPRATLARPTPPNRYNNNQNNISNIFQLVSNTFPRPGAFGNRDVQNNNDDFTPNDYERLLELDSTIASKALTKEQINRLPTERFDRPKNRSAEENKCSICWDEFEQNQLLRRLRCFHLYHQECIDNWLKDKNQCPICRIPPIQ